MDRNEPIENQEFRGARALYRHLKKETREGAVYAAKVRILFLRRARAASLETGRGSGAQRLLRRNGSPQGGDAFGSVHDSPPATFYVWPRRPNIVPLLRVERPTGKQRSV
jgi:hypothetical protein